MFYKIRHPAKQPPNLGCYTPTAPADDFLDSFPTGPKNCALTPQPLRSKDRLCAELKAALSSVTKLWQQLPDYFTNQAEFVSFFNGVLTTAGDPWYKVILRQVTYQMPCEHETKIHNNDGDVSSQQSNKDDISIITVPTKYVERLAEQLQLMQRTDQAMAELEAKGVPTDKMSKMSECYTGMPYIPINDLIKSELLKYGRAYLRYLVAQNSMRIPVNFSRIGGTVYFDPLQLDKLLARQERTIPITGRKPGRVKDKQSQPNGHQALGTEPAQPRPPFVQGA